GAEERDGEAEPEQPVLAVPPQRADVDRGQPDQAPRPALRDGRRGAEPLGLVELLLVGHGLAPAGLERPLDLTVGLAARDVPPLRSAKARWIVARPSRSAFTSVPWSTSPASTRSRSSNSCRARRLSAISFSPRGLATRASVGR